MIFSLINKCHHHTTELMPNLKAEAIQEVSPNPSLVTVTALRMQVNVE